MNPQKMPFWRIEVDLEMMLVSICVDSGLLSGQKVQLQPLNLNELQLNYLTYYYKLQKILRAAKVCIDRK